MKQLFVLALVTMVLVATQVVAGIGQHLPRTDIVVRSASSYAVTGRLLVAGHPPDYASLDLLPRGEEPNSIAIGSGGLDPSGSFSIHGVLPGDYELHYLAGTGAGHTAGRFAVRVLDRDVNVGAIDAAPPIDVTGSIVSDVSSAASARNIRLRLSLANSMLGPVHEAVAAEDGSFAFEGVSPGRYRLRVSEVAGAHVSSVRYGAADITGATVPIEGPGSALRVNLASGSGRIEGKMTVLERTRLSGLRMSWLYRSNRIRSTSIPDSVSPRRRDGFSWSPSRQAATPFSPLRPWIWTLLAIPTSSSRCGASARQWK